MSVWDVPRTDQLPAGRPPALFNGTDQEAVCCLTAVRHDDHWGFSDVSSQQFVAPRLDTTAALPPSTARRFASQQVSVRLNC